MDPLVTRNEYLGGCFPSEGSSHILGDVLFPSGLNERGDSLFAGLLRTDRRPTDLDRVRDRDRWRWRRWWVLLLGDAYRGLYGDRDRDRDRCDETTGDRDRDRDRRFSLSRDDASER